MDDSLNNIYRMRQSGASLESIASQLGTTKRAIKEQLVSHYGSTEVYGLLTVGELARLTGYSRDYVIKLKRRGVIQPVKAGRANKWWPPETIATIIIYTDRNPPVCRICHRPLSGRRSVFCSEACRIEGGRFRNRPQQVKDRQRETMRRWRRDHPEQVKAIERRAREKHLARRLDTGG